MATEHLTLDETADLTRISPNTLRWWRQQGTGPRSFKLGRRVMYRRDDVEAFLEEAYAGAASK